jgi:hypothetical protein
MRVTVAGYGPSAAEVFGPNYFQGPSFFDLGPGVPWEARPKVEVDVTEGETLADVIDQAAEAFGLVTVRGEVRTGAARRVSEVVAGIAFHNESDDAIGGQPTAWLSAFPWIDKDGELFWKWPTEASYDGLVRAFDEGLLTGDPRRVYLWPIVPQGGEVDFGSWPHFLETLRLFKDVAEVLAVSAGTYEFGKYLTDFVSRIRGESKVRADELDRHDVGPFQMREVLRPQVNLSQLQRFFGFDKDETTALVSLFGFDVDETGVIVFAEGPDGRFQRKLLRHALVGSVGGIEPDNEALRKFAEARLDALAAGKDEPAMLWGQEWHAATTPEAVEGFGVQEDPDTESNIQTEYRIITFPTNDGIDSAELEAQLNRVAAEGFQIHETYADQPLGGKQRGFLFILVRF